MKQRIRRKLIKQGKIIVPPLSVLTVLKDDSLSYPEVLTLSKVSGNTLTVTRAQPWIQNATHT